MRIHLIAIGGAVMHNLALALQLNGNTVSGSDDEIYNPARKRLTKVGILPEKDGWFPEKITSDIDCIILGMHASADNPELLKAQTLGLKIYSFPEYIYEHSAKKMRVVIAGSHGKTTTTSMIMHILKNAGIDFDYLVGAQLDGFNNMVRLSDAPIIIIEGDEYLSSAIDRVPKIWHYKPNIAVITGIAWDHVNVFPTFESYVNAFEIFIKTINSEGILFYADGDSELKKIAKNVLCNRKSYKSFENVLQNETNYIFDTRKNLVPISVFGKHNLANMRAAYLVCRRLNIPPKDFFKNIGSFTGAAKRLQILHETPTHIVFSDFAHAPSKVRATVDAVKNRYPERKLVACLELHTYSSLSKDFLPQYKNTLKQADIAVVFFNEHTLEMKKMPPLNSEDMKKFFGNQDLKIFTTIKDLELFLNQLNFKNTNLLMMSSGNFMGLDLKKISQRLLTMNDER